MHCRIWLVGTRPRLMSVLALSSLSQKLERAIDSGAQYLVTPTMNLPVIKLAVERQIAVFPGGLTPTELAAGWAVGATAVKIFPAQTVGAGYLKHLRGPFPDLEAIPSGGVDLDATREWLDAGAAAVSIGGPLLGDSLKGGDLTALRERCRAVRAVIMETVPLMTSLPTATVLTFGEALVGYASVEDNLRTATQFTRFPGGADLNVAVGLTRLGIRTIWASVLGDDAHADYLADAVDQLGIIPLVRRASGPTALMFKAGGATGDPEILQVRHHTAFAQHADALLTGDVLALEGIDHVHLTGITLGISPVVRAVALALLEAAIAARVSVSFDPNLRLNLWPDRDEMRTVVNTFAARATVVMPGLGEGQLLTDHDNPEGIAKTYLDSGTREVVIKLGAEGAQAWTADGQTAKSRAFAVTPIDTVGAGDGFAAGYVAAFLAAANLQERVDQGAAVGALATARRGDLDAMPQREEVDALINSTSPQPVVPATHHG